MKPFVLHGCIKLPPEEGPSDQHLYDDHLQLWIDKISGKPLIFCLATGSQQTKLGETAITASREGVDQPEGTALQASRFGETTLTDTREAADQTEAASLQASQFGETIHTRTREGVDQSEGTALRASQLGETTLTKTREGADQTEGHSPTNFNAPHSHF